MSPRELLFRLSRLGWSGRHGCRTSSTSIARALTGPHRVRLLRGHQHLPRLAVGQRRQRLPGTSGRTGGVLPIRRPSTPPTRVGLNESGARGLKPTRSDIAKHATDARAAQRLLDWLRNTGRQRPSSDAVHAAFIKWKLDVPTDEMREVSRRRHRSAHRLLMNDTEEDRDVSRDLDRITIVRTLLVAAVAHEAGYSGPLNGWAWMRFGQPRWWPVTEDAAVARRWYACLRANLDATPSPRGAT